MTDNLINLEGRVVIVAGAAGGGIGTHVVSLAARAGATVTAVSRSAAKLERDIAPVAAQGLRVQHAFARPSSAESGACAHRMTSCG